MWRERVRAGLENVDPLATVRRSRHAVRTGFGRTDRRLTARYFETSDEPKLHIGCGTRLFDGWLNTDWSPRTTSSMRLDVREPFPFPDATFRYVYAEHVIEHVDFAHGRHMCDEVFRVLQPGGVVRLATPDLSRLLMLFRDEPPLTEIEHRYIDDIRTWCWPDEPLATANPVFTLNNNVRDWGHRFLYDAATIEGLLASVGFDPPVRCELQDSEHAVLAGLANEGRMPDGLVDFETMTFEAQRPG